MIALLRAVNLGGKRMVAMSDLRHLVASLGFANVRSILQSGNLIFDSKKNAAQVEALLEKESKKRFGIEIDFFVRTAAEVGAIIEANPFPKEAKNDPSRLLVLFMKDEGDGKTLQKAVKDREVARGKGRQLYVYFPDGQGRTRLTTALIEKSLGTRVTARNWNTVLKLKQTDER